MKVGLLQSLVFFNLNLSKCLLPIRRNISFFKPNAVKGVKKDLDLLKSLGLFQLLDVCFNLIHRA